MTTKKEETTDAPTDELPDVQNADNVNLIGRKLHPDGVVVAWVGTAEDQSNIRSISSADFATLNIESEDVVFDRTDPMSKGQALVSDRVADYLTEIEPGFQLVTDEDRAFKFR